MIWLLLFQCISGRPVCVSAPEEDTVHARAASMNVFQSELQWKTLYTVETATSYWFWKKSCFFRISLGVTLVSAVRRVSWHLRPSLLFCPRVSPAWGCHPITASPHCGGQRSASPVGFWPVEKPWSSTETVEDTLLRPPWTVHRPGTHTHTHTHTHTCFHVLWGLCIGVMVFLLYKLYFWSPNPNPTAKPLTQKYRHFYILNKITYNKHCLVCF